MTFTFFASAAAVESQVAHLFHQLHAGFQKAQRTAGSIERSYDLAGRTVRLRFAGEALVPQLAPALAHLRCEPARAAQLTVCLWDTASTATPLDTPTLKAGAKDGDATAQPLVYFKDLLFFKDRRFLGVLQPRAKLLSALDTASDLAVLWVPDGSDIPAYETSHPLRSVFHWWMRSQGLQFAHAAAVGTRESGVLLVGKGGSGKSTTALAALQSGLAYAGDDYVLLEAGPVPLAHSIYSSGKLSPAAIDMLPHMAAAVRGITAAEGEKAVVFLNDHFPNQIARRLPIRSIVLPKVTGRPKCRLTRVSAAACLAALAPSTLVQLRGADQRDLHNMAAFVRTAPSYLLELGDDMADVRQVLLDLTRGAGHELRAARIQPSPEQPPTQGARRVI